MSHTVEKILLDHIHESCHNMNTFANMYNVISKCYVSHMQLYRPREVISLDCV